MKILITGCGGAPSINFTRCLADTGHTLYGVDQNKYTVHRSECYFSKVCLPVTSDYYIDFLNKVIEDLEIDFIHAQPEKEIRVISERREDLKCKTFLPSKESVKTCIDKGATWEIWNNAGIKVPRQIRVNSYKDLLFGYQNFKKVWIRETSGAGGNGSLKNPSIKLAEAWIDENDRWGNYLIAECLTDRTTTYQTLWNDGVLMAGQGRERIYWEAGNRTQSGVTGMTGTAKIVNDPKLTALAIQCIKAIDTCPHGIWSVDFTYDEDGVPNPTEVNIGKFFTTHEFLARTGCNMPEMMVDLVQGKKVEKKIDVCRDSYWIRGMDVKPILYEGEI